MTVRCGWCGEEEVYVDYHDKEWGVPLHNDRKHFEFLILEGAQAGLSWITILKRREGYRKAFDDFDPNKIVKYDKTKIEKLLENKDIVRNKRKILAAVENAKAFLKVQEEFGTFDNYIWKFVGGKTIKNQWRSLDDIPSETPESKAMSKDLKKRGFKFVGPTICYAYMQATGMVNDHIVDCFRYDEV